MAFEGLQSNGETVMTTTRTILSLSLLAGLVAGTASAQAGETIFKDGVPQAAELARILGLPRTGLQGPMGATRESSSINPDVAPEAAAAQPAAHVEL